MSNSHPTLQAVREAMARAAAECGWLSYDGPNLTMLREHIGRELDRQHVRLCCSGTFGIELALRSLKLPTDAEVLLAGYDFPGNFRAIQDAGASVALFDVAFNDWVPDVEQLRRAVGPKTKAIIVSHLHGALAPMALICDWARVEGLFVIEDACQVHGAIVDGMPAGAWGDASVFSFGGSKLIASGRGGAVVTNLPTLAQRMTIFCERGNDAFPLSELQAAILLPQYQFLHSDHTRRLQEAQRLSMAIAKLNWLSISPGSRVNRTSIQQPAYYKFGLLIRDAILKSSLVQAWLGARTALRETNLSSAKGFVLEKLQTAGLQVGPGFRGFADRSASRCRTSVPLLHSRLTAESTIVLHHSHLLDPLTGESSVERVIEIIQQLDQEMFP